MSTSIKSNGTESKVSIDIRFKNNEPGIVLDQGSITGIVIIESLFSLMPIINIKFMDSGTYFDTFNLTIGDNIYVNIKSNVDSQDNKSLVDAVYCVQTYNCYPDPKNGTYSYEINGTLNRQSYLNKVVPYPFKNILADNLPFPIPCTSDSVLGDVGRKAGFPFTSNVKTTDSGVWLNANQTMSQFMQKVVEHSWCGNGNATLLWADINGNMTYDSINDMCDRDSVIDGYYRTNISDDMVDDKSCFITYDEVQLSNQGGPILNKGGYKMKAFLFDPYYGTSLTSQDMERLDLKDYLSLNKILGRISATYKSDNGKIAAFSSKDETQNDNVYHYIDGGIQFENMHQQYTFAKYHNEMVKRAFFTNFIRVLVDTDRLIGLARELKYLPNLGEKIKMNFSYGNNANRIQTGEYLLCSIRHMFKGNGGYSLGYTLVSDGTNDSGESTTEIK